MKFLVLISGLPSKITGISSLDNQILIIRKYSFLNVTLLNSYPNSHICSLFTFLILSCVIVTESGLSSYGLMPFGPGRGYEELVSGSFAGIDVLGPETDFPVILTTSKGPDCSFLEMRGKL